MGIPFLYQEKEKPMTEIIYKNILIKSGSSSGHFQGYANVYDIVDRQGDRIRPGAFLKSIDEHSQAKTGLNVYFEHKTHLPIGKITKMQEVYNQPDHNGEKLSGLLVEGRLLLTLPCADYAWKNIKNMGLSVGIQVIVSGKYTTIRDIYLARLVEVSFTQNPANTKSRIITSY